MDKDKTPPSLRERISAGINAVLDPKGQAEITAEDKAEARSAAELLTTATKKPEQIAENAKAQVAIVEDASTQLQAMVADTATTPDLSKVNALVSTAEAAGKALDAQEAALKSAQEAFDKSNPDLSKAEAEPDGAKKDEEKAIQEVVKKGNEAMAAIAPAREVLYQMWLQDCQAVADVIAGKKKPEDIKPPVVHTLMGALDAYSKDKEKFKLDGPQKIQLNAVVAQVRAVTDPKPTELDRFTFDEAKYNEARAKKAVIDRDAAPVTLRPEQAAKVAQKEKLDKAIADVDVEKKKLTVAQGEVEQKRKELVGRVEKDATAAFDKVQDKIDQLGIDAQKTAPGEVLSADDKRTRHADVSKSWEEALKKFQDVNPERAQEVTKSLADLTKLLFPEQVDKSGKKQAFSHLNFRSMYDNLAKNIGKIGKTKAGKFVGGAINSARSGLDTIVRKLNGEEVEKVKTEKDAQAWVESIKAKAKSIEERIEAAYSSVPDDLRKKLEISLESTREGIYSLQDQERLSELITICDGAATKLNVYYGNHDELESLLVKAENFIDKAKEMALVLNLARVEQMIIDLTKRASESNEDNKLSPEERRIRFDEVMFLWIKHKNTYRDSISKTKLDGIDARIIELGHVLFPEQKVSNEPGNKIFPHNVLKWAKLVPGWGWLGKKGAEAKAAIGDVFHREAKGDKGAGQAASGEAPASASEYAATNEDEAKQQLVRIREKGQRDYYRMGFAYRSVHEDMRGEFDKQLDAAQILTMNDRFKFHELLDLCEAAQDVLVPYNANRAELIVLLQKTQAYAEKAEAIAQALNAERLDPGEGEKARIALTELTRKKTDFLSRHHRALESVAVDKQNEFTRRINLVMRHPDTDRFSQLMQMCQQTPDRASAYDAHRAELEGIVEGLKAYAEKSEEIARELNATAANTVGNPAEGGAGVAREPTTASEAMAWLNGIRERSKGFLGAIKQVETSVNDRKAIPKFNQELKAYEDSQGGPITYGDLERRLTAFENSQDKLQYYRNHHQEIEAKVDAYAKYIEQAKAIAERLNSPESPAGGAAGEPAQGPRREAPENKSEARAETSELVDWINSTSRRLVKFTDRFSTILAQMNTDEKESFQKTKAFESYRGPYDSAVRVYDRLRSGYVQGNNLYPTAQEFTAAKEEVEKLLKECEQNLATAETNITKIKTELSEGDKLADKVEAQSFLDSVTARMVVLDSMVKDIRKTLSQEDVRAFVRSPAASSFYTAVWYYNMIHEWLRGVDNAPVITVTKLREARKRIPELIAQCEGPINTDSANLKKKLNQ